MPGMNCVPFCCCVYAQALRFLSSTAGQVSSQATRLGMQVLEKDPDNVKALFRRAQAYMMTQDYIEAKQDLGLAIKSEPTNRLVFSCSILEPACLLSPLSFMQTYLLLFDCS